MKGDEGIAMGVVDGRLDHEKRWQAVTAGGKVEGGAEGWGSGWKHRESETPRPKYKVQHIII